MDESPKKVFAFAPSGSEVRDGAISVPRQGKNDKAKARGDMRENRRSALLRALESIRGEGRFREADK
jgi:hypothetical protein